MHPSRPYKLAILNSHPVQYFAPLYKRLARETEIDLTVYYCSRQGLDQYTDPGFGKTFSWDIDLTEGYHHVFLKNMRSSDSLGGFFSLVNPGIINELRRNQFDALWINGHNYASYLIGFFAARAMGTRVFMRSETHLQLRRSALKLRIRRFVLKYLYSHCSACLAIGTRNAEFYRYCGVPEDKITIVPYTVDNEYFVTQTNSYREERSNILRDLNLQNDLPIILYASKLTQRKHPMDLLFAYQRLTERGVKAALIFVGSGSELESLKQYTLEHHLDHVRFVGFKNQSELPKYYAAAEIFVLPSENEPWGLIINEVMCAGLPIIASSEVGAVTDLLHDGTNGFVFPVGNVDYLSDKLEVLCSSSDLRRKMGRQSLQRIRQWSNDEVAERVLEVLMEKPKRRLRM